jgi:hypothetical protein
LGGGVLTTDHKEPACYKMLHRDLKKVEDDTDWIYFFQDREQWHSLVNRVMDFWDI